MKKLFTKIASLTLGLALAAGAVAFLGGRTVKSASASEAIAASCDLTDTSVSTTGYSKEHDLGDYLVYGGQNNNGGWEYYKFGAKKAKSTDPTKVTEAYIKSKSAISEDVTKVEIILLASSTNGITVNWTVDYSSESDFSSKQTIDKGSLNNKAAGSYYANPESGTFGSNKYFCVNFHIENTTTTNGVLFLTKVNFYYESSVERGEISIGNLNDSVYYVGDSGLLTVGWDPLLSGASVKSHSFASDNTDVLNISGDTFTAIAPGKAKITLNVTDTNDEEYSIVSDTIYVSKEYSFEIGDTVVLYSSGASKELTSINKSGTTYYGEGTDYSSNPNGTLLWTVEGGNASGSLAFVNDSNYLCWSSGNSLTTKTSLDDNSSWYVVSYDDYDLIINAATTSREIWWNSGTPRFACYEGKTTETSGYNATNLAKIEEAPVRGTLAITAPTSTTMRTGVTDSLTYSWTPAEESSATIASYEWTSSDTDVITVSNEFNTFETVGPGKAKITLTATDTNSQEYSVSTADITVVAVVSGSYVKLTSVSDGDVVALVCETAETQMSGISNKIGSYVFYDTAPGSVFDFTLEASGEYFALKTSEDKYLNWISSTDLSLVDEASSDNALWSISFDGEGNATIANKALDGEDHRYLAWNNSSPRFTTYKSGQTAIQLYGPASSPEYEENVLTFVNSMLDYSCDASGEEMPGVSAWDSLNTYFTDNVSSEGKLLLKGFDAVEHVSPATDTERIEAAMAKYDYIVAKYNLGLGLDTDFPDFINREPAPLRNISNATAVATDTNSAVIVVTVIAITSLSAIAVLLVIKRRRAI